MDAPTELMLSGLELERLEGSTVLGTYLLLKDILRTIHGEGPQDPMTKECSDRPERSNATPSLQLLGIKGCTSLPSIFKTVLSLDRSLMMMGSSQVTFQLLQCQLLFLEIIPIIALGLDKSNNYRVDDG